MVARCHIILKACALLILLAGAVPAMAQIYLSGEKPVVKALLKGDVDAVGEYLLRGESVDQLSNDKTPLLILATQRGMLSMAELLLEYGAKPGRTDQLGNIALSWAALNGNYDMADTLLAWDSPINHRNFEGQTPLSMAAYQGAANIVALLLDYGSNPNQTDFTGKSALDWARLRQSNQRTVELLQEAVAQSGQP